MTQFLNDRNEDGLNDTNSGNRYAKDREQEDVECHNSISTTSDGDSKSNDSPSTPRLAVEETKQVNQVKFFFFVVLLVSILGALFVYFYMTLIEQEQFEEKFDDDSRKLLSTLINSLEQTLGAFDSLGLTIVSIARFSNQTFPFVTIPEYGLHALKTIPLTKALATYFQPVVSFEQRREWELYAARNNSHLESYVNKTLRLQDDWEGFYGPKPQNYTWVSNDVIYSDFGDVPYDTPRENRLDFLIPEWHRFPLIMTTYPPANWDAYSMVNPDGITKMLTNRKAIVTHPLLIPEPGNEAAMMEAQIWCTYYTDFISPDEECMEPVSLWLYPIIDNIDQESIAKADDYPEAYEVKAAIVAEFYWRGLIRDIMPDSSRGLILVFSNSCVRHSFTYQIDGPKETYLGVGDYHNTKYNYMARSTSMLEVNKQSSYTGLPLDDESCTFTFQVYPSDEMEDYYKTNNGIIFAISAVLLIVFPFLVFILYDRKVSKQRETIVSNAKRSNAILSSLYPSTVRDELYPVEGNDREQSNSKPSSGPIAKLYADTTVLFADIANFTVWASVRDPFQVFTLLETIYVAFDKIAKRRRVFKVETVGDSYIAVAGLPDPRSDHAVVMVKFAKDIIHEMNNSALHLEVLLGPGTSSLMIRVGLNSGPTTAGVLRGVKGRFQIFGDTVNTASRMESNSIPGRIMCTEQTANYLIAAGKEHWIKPRLELVEAKGKGSLQCYWCNPTANTASSKGSDDRVMSKDNETEEMDEMKLQRLVDWMTEMLEEMLHEVISNRASYADVSQLSIDTSYHGFLNPRDEVSEVIALRKATLPLTNHAKVDPFVKSQLKEYIATIASLYKENPFHNFQHACHVVMSARKLLSRVVKSDESTTSSTAYGISSDQLTQFAIVFSALIHDVDHPGVSNGQLVIEEAEVAVKYNNKSVAEQNSITIAWDLLLLERFSELRQSIMSTDSECRHFRQLIVNAVLATDLFDRDLKELRESRWSKAFDTDVAINSTGHISEEDSNRRATIVIEHVIQAADVSHTMQHWHIYQKWNRHLLQEMYLAFMEGRAEKDPTIGWYDGELWFFDNYIIPLANKLKTCGVFGVSCDELLDYAKRNRAEWAAKGKTIVAESVELIKSGACKSTSGSTDNTSSFTDVTNTTTTTTTNRSLLISAFSTFVAENSSTFTEK